jgi:hypothetical protein
LHTDDDLTTTELQESPMMANRQSSVDSARFIHPKPRQLTPRRPIVAEATRRLDRHSANTAIANR